MRKMVSIIRDARDSAGSGGDGRRTSYTLRLETVLDPDQPGLTAAKGCRLRASHARRWDRSVCRMLEKARGCAFLGVSLDDAS